MIDIIVIRQDGLVQGDDIVDPLLSSFLAAMARGEQELNETSTGLISKSIEIPYESGLEPGLYAFVIDDFLLETYVGKIDNVDINVVAGDKPSAYVQLQLLVPEDFFNPSAVVRRP